MTDEQRRAYAEAYARAEADRPGAMAAFLLGEPLPFEVTAVAEVLGLDPEALGWHVEAEHGHEAHDEGYEASVWRTAECTDPEHLEESRRAGTRRAVAPVRPGVIAERLMRNQPRRTSRQERRR